MRLDIPMLGGQSGSGSPAGQNGDHHLAAPQRPLSTSDRSASGRVKLGDLSMRYETGYEPGQEYLAAAKVSSGFGDPGGVSYGAYQLNSKKGDKVRNFLSNEGAPWFSRFQGLDETVSGGAFAETWTKIAHESPQSFFDAQHAYIKRTNYGHTVAVVEKKTGVNLDAMSIAVRNVVWSVSVQHGGAHIILERALHDVNADDMRSQNALMERQPQGMPYSALDGDQGWRLSMFTFDIARVQFERDFILAIYRERRHYVRVDAKLSTANLEALDSRYEREQHDALEELKAR